MNKHFLELSRWWTNLPERIILEGQILFSIVAGFFVLHSHYYGVVWMDNLSLELLITFIYSLLLFMPFTKIATIAMREYIEIKASHTELLQKNAQLEEMQAELTEKNKRLAELAVKDPMTGAYNKLSLYDTIERVSSQATRHKEEVYFLFIDLNRLRDINNIYGHTAGDSALITVTKIIWEHIRIEDRLFRVGGDEFFLAIPVKKNDSTEKEPGELSGLEKILELVDRINNAISNAKFFHETSQIPLSASIGVHLYNNANNIEDEIASADKQMYKVKNGHEK